MEAIFFNKQVVKDFDKLPCDMPAVFSSTLLLMEAHGCWNIGLPYVRHITNTPLYEIRMRGASGISRAMFVTLKNDKLLVLNVFVKKTQKTPRQEISLALKRLKEVQYD